MAKIYDGILYSHQAMEIAAEETENFPQNPPQTEEGAAKFWFQNVICDEEVNEQPMPRYHKHICEICDGWSMYYDYGADYYFAVKEWKETEYLQF